MNFLAHAFLSGDDSEILVGNFVADSIKGRMIDKYSPMIQTGVVLHRAIDHFTDTHPIVRQSVSRLQPTFRKYAGVVADIYFDHYLALHWKSYSEVELQDFASHVYMVLLKRYTILPPRTKRILPWMIAQNWLVGYANLNDLQRVFNGMSRRTSFYSGMEDAVDFLRLHYDEFHQDFVEYFPHLMLFCKQTITEIKLQNPDVGY